MPAIAFTNQRGRPDDALIDQLVEVSIDTEAQCARALGRLLDTLASRNLITPKDVLHIVGVYQPDGAIEPKFV